MWARSGRRVGRDCRAPSSHASLHRWSRTAPDWAGRRQSSCGGGQLVGRSCLVRCGRWRGRCPYEPSLLRWRIPTSNQHRRPGVSHSCERNVRRTTLPGSITDPHLGSHSLVTWRDQGRPILWPSAGIAPRSRERASRLPSMRVSVLLFGSALLSLHHGLPPLAASARLSCGTALRCSLRGSCSHATDRSAVQGALRPQRFRAPHW